MLLHHYNRVKTDIEAERWHVAYHASRRGEPNYYIHDVHSQGAVPAPSRSFERRSPSRDDRSASLAYRRRAFDESFNRMQNGCASTERLTVGLNKGQRAYLGKSNRRINPAVLVHIASMHPSRTSMHNVLHKKLIKNPGYTHADVDAMPDECFGCEMGKATRLKFSGSHIPGLSDSDVVVYSDVFGPTRTKSHGDYDRYCLFVTRQCRWSYIYLMRREKDYPETLKIFLRDYHADKNAYPTAVFTDGGPVNVSKTAKQIMSDKGISWSGTIPHCSEQNPAERYIRTINNIARCLIQHSGRPQWMWGWAVKTACYLRNRWECRGNPGCKSPYEMRNGHAPDISNFRMWGSTVYSALPHDDRENARGESLGAAAEVGILVGYTERRLQPERLLHLLSPQGTQGPSVHPQGPCSGPASRPVPPSVHCSAQRRQRPRVP